MTVFEQEEKEGENPWKALPHHDVTFISPKPTLADDRGITFMPVVYQIFFFFSTYGKRETSKRGHKERGKRKNRKENTTDERKSTKEEK